VGLSKDSSSPDIIERMFDRIDALKRIECGSCACSGCTGRLTEAASSPGGWGFCRNCRCAWKVSAIDGHQYATTIPSKEHAARK
jgi:hypothetical protein